MSKSLVIMLVVAFGVVAGISINSIAKEEVAGKEAEKKSAADQAAFMEAWIKAGEPGKVHARLAESVGKWKVENKSFEKPGEPEVTYGSAEIRTIFGGRYLEEKFKGEYQGQPFEGIGYTGYDNLGEKYVFTWMDSMSTGIAVMEGTYDPKTQTTVAIGEMSAPGGTKMKMRSVTRDVNKDLRIMEMYMPGPDGKEIKSFEMTYKRVKN